MTSTNINAPPVVIPSSSNNIVISPLQRGNPILQSIRNVGIEYGDIAADYQVGKTTGVLFLSLKYHRLHPEYIHTRIEKLGIFYNLRILLILCDISEHREPIRELTKACLINNMTVIVAFSSEEAGHYLTTYKQFEFKPPDFIKERAEKDYYPLLRSALTSISKVNKTDVETLRSSFGNFANISKATPDQLQNLPGFGQVKVKNIKNAFEKPFRNQATSSLSLMASQSRSQAEARVQCPQPPRESSPIWGIELEDVDLPAEAEGPSGPSRWLNNNEVFDIDLDLT
ncbi:restriction endonuclease type II-like protein, partial [Gymnopilus junonius]